MNYRDHALETEAASTAEPIIFLKVADTVVGPNDAVVFLRSPSKTHWEVDLAVNDAVVDRPVGASFRSTPDDCCVRLASLRSPRQLR
jgi:2-keto-4-pentenoate hydratase/2-oxohepta-3-ene-1,7-dioic acid hydratase in catechol pathway